MKIEKIWIREATVEKVNAWSNQTMMETLGIEFTEVGPNYLIAKMPVDHRTFNPNKILHGGASATLAETLGSIASWLCIEEGKIPVGLEINANHLRSVTNGFVYGKVTPVHVGRSTHVWQIQITNSDNKLVCTSRLTVFVK